MSEHDGSTEKQAAVDAEQELARQYRDDWFTRQLGDGWVSGGDGVYYPPGSVPPRPEPVETLEEALQSSLPSDTPEEAFASDRDGSQRRGLWRRR